MNAIFQPCTLFNLSSRHSVLAHAHSVRQTARAWSSEIDAAPGRSPVEAYRRLSTPLPGSGIRRGLLEVMGYAAFSQQRKRGQVEG